MRLVPLLLLLDLATAFAQPRLSPPVLSTPLPAQASNLALVSPAVAIARDRTGVAIAWTMNVGGEDRVHVARLNGDGQLAGEIRVMPGRGIAPSLASAPSGEGFVLAWLAVPDAVYSLLDARLEGTTPWTLAPISFEGPPAVRSGNGTWIAAGDSLWPIGEDGSAGARIGTGIVASDMTVATRTPVLVSGNDVHGTNYTCKPDLGCRVAGGPFRGFCYEQCRIYEPLHNLRLVALYSLAAGHDLPFATEARPAVAPDGDGVLMAWSNGSEVVAASVPAPFTNFAEAVAHPIVLGTFDRDSGRTRPDIATDGRRHLIVWSANHDIAGAVLDADGRVTPLAIATTSADQRDPSVVLVDDGRFLVAWEQFDESGRRIAGRFVTFGEKRRAAR